MARTRFIAKPTKVFTTGVKSWVDGRVNIYNPAPVTSRKPKKSEAYRKLEALFPPLPGKIE